MTLTPKDFRLSTKGVVIGGDNIPFSAKRREAYMAYRQGKASPEQMELLQATDDMIRKANEGDNSGGRKE